MNPELERDDPAAGSAVARGGQEGEGRTVNPEEILQDLPKNAARLRPRLSPTQQAGMKLAWGVGGLIAGICVLVTIFIIVRTMSAPDSPTQLTGSDAETAIANYQSLTDIHIDQGLRIFDTVVARVLLPVFTAILGYVFGSRHAIAMEEAGDNAPV